LSHNQTAIVPKQQTYLFIMSIFNNNDFTLSTEAQQAIETIFVNLSLDDVRLGMQYNGIYPIYDNDTDNYIGSVNLETLEFTHDLSSFVDSFFATGVFALGNERDSEIEDSENMRVEIIEEVVVKVATGIGSDCYYLA